MSKVFSKREITKIIHSVTVLLENSRGYASGLAVQRLDSSFVFTAAHFLYKNDYKTPVGGSIWVKRWFFDGKKKVVKKTLAEVKIISKRLDFAILKLKDSDFFIDSAPIGVVDINDGDRVYCCGAMISRRKLPPILSGKIIVSEEGDKEWIKVSSFIKSGCSGSGLFLSNGLCVGLAFGGWKKSEGGASVFKNFKTICEWAKRNGSFEKYFPEVVGVRKSRKERRSE